MTGTGFVSGSVVNLNSTALTTTYVNPTTLTAAVPDAAIAGDGTVQLSVVNPAPGGGTSAQAKYNITVPTPTIASVSPQSLPQGIAATVTVKGSGFEANSVVRWNGTARTTTYVNSSTVKVALTANDVQSFGLGALSVINPGVPPTTPLDVAILASKPTITSVGPSVVTAYTSPNIPQLISIYGSGFAANATVQANGKAVTVTSQNATTIYASVSASFFASAGTISIVVNNPGSPTISSNPGTITVVGPSAPSFTVSPGSIAAGSPDTTLTLWGSGFYADSQVYWNNVKLTTTYASSSSVTAVVPASLIAGLTQASISVNTPENTTQAPTQPVTTFLALPTNDIVYNSVDGYIYASVPGSAGPGLGNTVDAIDPVSGVIQKTIQVGSEPNRLAISSDGKQLFVGLDGASSVRQVDLTAGTAGVQFAVPVPSSPFYNNGPYKAASLAAVPGSPNAVAVSSSAGIISIFDSGVARSNNSSNALTSFYLNTGSLAFGSSASTLYVNNGSGSIYRLTVDSTGILAYGQVTTGASYSNTLQYDSGNLYVPVGLVFNSSTGAQAGQFSVSSSYSSGPTPANGPIVSDSSLNRAWIAYTGNYGSSYSVLAFDETTFNPLGSMPVNISTGSYSSSDSPADLIRWGGNGIAFHTPTKLYVLHGSIVNDNSSSPANLEVNLSAPSTGTTGSALTYTFTVLNHGPNIAQGITLSSILPSSVLVTNVTASQGSCSGANELYCDLTSLVSGGSATVTVATKPTVAGTLSATAVVTSTSFDGDNTNNQASATTTVSGSLYSGSPVVTQLSPAMVQAGSGTFTLTVNGTGFTANSVLQWNGVSLTTTLVSSGQLTASVDASKITQLGWATVSVLTSGDAGGGQSNGLPISIYQLVSAPANAMVYDPFTQKLYAVLPSTSSSPTGNSLVTIDPTSGSIGTPLVVGSEPNELSETSDGNYLYMGLSGAKAVRRYSLVNHTLDAAVPLPAISGSTYAASALAAVPGSDTSLAVEQGSNSSIGILDIVGGVGTLRSKTTPWYDGNNPVFYDNQHFYANNGAQLYRYSIDSTGVTAMDTYPATLTGLGNANNSMVLDGGLVFGPAGGIVKGTTTPPSQVAVLPLGTSSNGWSYTGAGVAPYATEGKAFIVAQNSAWNLVLERFDLSSYTLDQQVSLPGANLGTNTQPVRWGQDGLALLLPSSDSSGNPTTQIFLIRGPFVLPAEAVTNSAPTVTTTDHNTITAGSGNVVVTVTGTGFLPGATVLWNGSARTTTYVSSTQVTVAIPASDVQNAATATIGCQNPGSAASGTVSITVQ